MPEGVNIFMVVGGILIVIAVIGHIIDEQLKARRP